ncbi:MAG: hypothetical protein J6S67_10075 [Methanobrevibacter sp.]|nr:hypothetical protein [Methanobrevibacter sp.]
MVKPYFKELEYIESTGTQYIDSGIIPNQSEGIVLKAAYSDLTTNYGRLFGTQAEGVGKTLTIRQLNSNSGPIYIEFGAMSGNARIVTYDTNIHTYSFNYPAGYVLFDNTELATSLNTYPDYTTTCWICGTNNVTSQYGKIKIYSLKVYRLSDNKLLKDFVPVLDFEKKACLYENIEGKYYRNLGTGDFVAGPTVESISASFRRMLLASVMATMPQKRPYYCEVENITSTTNCAINTGIYPQLNSIKIEIKAIKSTAYSLYGENDPAAKFNFTGSGTSAFFRYGISSSGYGSYTPSDVTKAYTFVQDKGTLYIDGVQTGTSAATETATASFPIALYCRFSADTLVPNDAGVHTIYYCKIWNGGYLVRDFIPVLDWTYTPCFYDKVSGGLFYNTGSGTLTAGREIHYVDYLESDGIQYINTGIKSSYNLDVKIDFEVPTFSGEQRIFGQSDVTYVYRFGYTASSIFVSNGSDYPYSTTVTSGNRYLLELNGKDFYVNGVLARTMSNVSIGSADCYLFAWNRSPLLTGVMKCYSCQIEENSVLVRDYKPAIDENGVGFMFDKVSHTIYDNAGTGVFKYPARETEYIEVTNLGTNNQNPCIDLGLKYKPSMSIESKYTRTEMGVSGSILPLSNSTTMSLIYMPALNANAKTDRFVWRRSGLPEASYYYDFADYPMTVEFKVDAVNDALTVNGNVVKTGMIAAMNGYTDPYESYSNLYMLSIDGTYGGMGKVYYLKLYEGTQIYRDLIPVWKDGVACMYDKQNNVYYSNTKTGTVICGKIVEPEYE